MKRFYLLVFLSLFVAVTVKAQNKLQVEVVGIEASKGVLRVGVYNKQEGCFDATKSFKGKIVKAQKGTMQFDFDLPNGNYVVAVIHDENNNGVLDKNFLGIPKEGYGFSGKATRPVYTDALFELKGNKKIVIKMQ